MIKYMSNRLNYIFTLTVNGRRFSLFFSRKKNSKRPRIFFFISVIRNAKRRKSDYTNFYPFFCLKLKFKIFSALVRIVMSF